MTDRDISAVMRRVEIVDGLDWRSSALVILPTAFAVRFILSLLDAPRWAVYVVGAVVLAVVVLYCLGVRLRVNAR